MLDRVCCQHATAAYSQEKRPDIHSAGDWVGLGAGRNGYRKSRPTWVPPSRPLRVAILQLIHSFSSRKCYIKKLIAEPYKCMQSCRSYQVLHIQPFSLFCTYISNTHAFLMSRIAKHTRPGGPSFSGCQPSPVHLNPAVYDNTVNIHSLCSSP